MKQGGTLRRWIISLWIAMLLLSILPVTVFAAVKDGTVAVGVYNDRTLCGKGEQVAFSFSLDDGQFQKRDAMGMGGRKASVSDAGIESKGLEGVFRDEPKTDFFAPLMVFVSLLVIGSIGLLILWRMVGENDKEKSFWR